MIPPKLVLSPIDFSDSSLSALDTATDIASRYDAELLLMHAVPVMPELPKSVSILKEGAYEQNLIQDAENWLKAMAKKVSERGVRARTTVGLANDAAMEIIRTAENEKADLIVIATHGMTGWRALAFGSVAEKVVKTADCPVLVLRSRRAGESAEREAKASAGATSTP
jgi:nucleotide-binding universal stress UspA family protein